MGELDYLRLLVRVSEFGLTEWRGKFLVYNEALHFPYSQLRAEFQYFRKDTPYWRFFV